MFLGTSFILCWLCSRGLFFLYFGGSDFCSWLVNQIQSTMRRTKTLSCHKRIESSWHPGSDKGYKSVYRQSAAHRNSANPSTDRTWKQFQLQFFNFSRTSSENRNPSCFIGLLELLNRKGKGIFYCFMLSFIRTYIINLKLLDYSGNWQGEPCLSFQ